MRNIYALYRRFVRLITIIKQEGFGAAAAAVWKFLVCKYFRLKYREYRLIVHCCNIFRHGLMLRNIQGSKMYLIANDPGLSRDLFLRSIREPLQTNLVKQLLKPGMTVVDIGANLGYYVLIEASIVGEAGKVYAIEPVTLNYEILRKNVHKNNYENIVETYQCAISDTCGISKIAITRESNYPSMFLNKNDTSEYMKERIETDTERILDVETVTLDKFLINKRPVDFIRMDVEGYEVKIIKGMADTVKNSGSGLKLFFELHPCLFRDPKAMVAEMIQDWTDLGLKVKFIVNSGGTELLDFSTDNLLEMLSSEIAPGICLEKHNINSP